MRALFQILIGTATHSAVARITSAISHHVRRDVEVKAHRLVEPVAEALADNLEPDRARRARITTQSIWNRRTSRQTLR